MKHLPVGLIRGSCIPEAFEKAVLWVWENGLDFPTKYDKLGDPPSSVGYYSNYSTT